MTVIKKVREVEKVVSGPTKIPDPDSPDYEEGVTYEKKEENE